MPKAYTPDEIKKLEENINVKVPFEYVEKKNVELSIAEVQGQINACDSNIKMYNDHIAREEEKKLSFIEKLEEVRAVILNK
jgi:hypothetical protein